MQPPEQQRAFPAPVHAPVKSIRYDVLAAAAESGHGGGVPRHGEEGLQEGAQGGKLTLRRDLQRVVGVGKGRGVKQGGKQGWGGRVPCQ